MEQGFGPKFSRIAAALCLFLFLGILDYALGLHRIVRVLLLLLLLGLLLSVVFPPNRRIRGVVLRITRAMYPGTLLEWLEDRFESLKTR